MFFFKQIHGGEDQSNREMSLYLLKQGLEFSSSLPLRRCVFGGTFGMDYKFLIISRKDKHKRAHLESQPVW